MVNSEFLHVLRNSNSKLYSEQSIIIRTKQNKERKFKTLVYWLEYHWWFSVTKSFCKRVLLLRNPIRTNSCHTASGFVVPLWCQPFSCQSQTQSLLTEELDSFSISAISSACQFISSRLQLLESYFIFIAKQVVFIHWFKLH